MRLALIPVLLAFAATSACQTTTSDTNTKTSATTEKSTRAPELAALDAFAGKWTGTATVTEITGELAKLPADRAPTGEEWARLSGTWSQRIDNRIAELQRLKRGLSNCIGCGCLSLDRCTLANPGDRARALGSGPRYWIADRPAP
jgi:hypothetical protein